MTIEMARRILAIEDEGRKTIATPGVIPADHVAKAFQVTRSDALTLIVNARDVTRRSEAVQKIPTVAHVAEHQCAYCTHPCDCLGGSENGVGGCSGCGCVGI